MSQHVVPVRTYVLVFLGLMALTALTVGASFVNIAHHLPSGWPNVFNDAAAMAIALAKASLVVLFFMGLKWSTRLSRLALLGALFFLVILFGFTLADYFSRGWLGVPGK